MDEQTYLARKRALLSAHYEELRPQREVYDAAAVSLRRAYRGECDQSAQLLADSWRVASRLYYSAADEPPAVVRARVELARELAWSDHLKRQAAAYDKYVGALHPVTSEYQSATEPLVKNLSAALSALYQEALQACPNADFLKDVAIENVYAALIRD